MVWEIRESGVRTGNILTGDQVRDKLPEAEKNQKQGLSFDAGISKDELIEYLEWLKENKPMEFFQLMDKLWKARAEKQGR